MPSFWIFYRHLLFCKCDLFWRNDPFLQVWLISLSVISIFQIWPTFGKCVTHFSTCYLFLNATHFCKCDPFFSIWPILCRVTRFCQWKAFFQVWCILKMWSVLQLRLIFAGVTNFFTMWPFYASVTECFLTVIYFK